MYILDASVLEGYHCLIILNYASLGMAIALSSLCYSGIQPLQVDARRPTDGAEGGLFFLYDFVCGQLMTTISTLPHSLVQPM